MDDLHACRVRVVERFRRLTSLIGAQAIFDGNVALADMDPVGDRRALRRDPSLST
jgi:hypothetical protein